MNDLYFVCTDCKTYLDAGYRWAYLELMVPGVVQEQGAVDVDRVLATEAYWKPPIEETSGWLYDEVLPSVRAFLERHRNHRLVFWEVNDLPDDVGLEWLQVGYDPRPTARYFVEVLGFSDWSSVLAWGEANGWSGWAFGDDAGRAAFREAFERHVRKRGR